MFISAIIPCSEPFRLELLKKEYLKQMKQRRNPSSAECPKCNSNETNSFEMVYQTGTSSGVGVGVGVGAGGKVMLGVGASTNKTLLAKKVAPPAKPTKTPFWIIGYFVFSLLSSLPIVFLWNSLGFWSFAIGFLLGGGGFVAILLLGDRVITKETSEYESNFRKWKLNWMCLKCGKEFRKVG